MNGRVELFSSSLVNCVRGSRKLSLDVFGNNDSLRLS